jgi:transposase InsO family protein
LGLASLNQPYQPDGGVDRAAAHRGFSLGRRPGLHDPGPRSDLWHCHHTPIASYGHSGQPIAAASPWQNGFAERLIGSIRRARLDHITVSGEAHLRRILISYAAYYNSVRTHRSLNKDAPIFRPIQQIGIIRSHPILGGFRHHYVRI